MSNSQNQPPDPNNTVPNPWSGSSMTSSQNQPPNFNNTAPNPWPNSSMAGMDDYELDGPWSMPPNLCHIAHPIDITAFGYEGQIDDGYVFDGTYDDNGEDDDVNEDDKGNLQWIAEQVYGTTDETGDEEINPPNEELSVFSDVVQQAFEKFENQNNNNPVDDDEEETMRQMLEAETYMLGEYYRKNTPHYYLYEQYAESTLNADAAEFRPRSEQ